MWKAKWAKLHQKEKVVWAYIEVMSIKPELILRVVKARVGDTSFQERIYNSLAGRTESYSVSSEYGLRFNGRLIIYDNVDLRCASMEEAHGSQFSVHIGGDKMYMDMRRQYWGESIKHNITEFVSKCTTCQMVKFSHQRPAGVLQPLDISSRGYRRHIGVMIPSRFLWTISPW